MKKATKIWLITGASLVLAGGILFAIMMSAMKWDFSKLSTVKYETNTHEINNPFDSISLTADSADVIFKLSNDGKCRVECYEEEKAKHSAAVSENTLIIKVADTGSWYDYIGFDFGSPKITVYLPKTEYDTLSVHTSIGNVKMPKDFAFQNTDISSGTGDADFYASVSKSVKIKTDTGNVRVRNIFVGSLDISSDTGEVTASGVTCRGDIKINASTDETNLADISCKNLISKGDTGDISLKNVTASEKFFLERTTGNVKFDGSDATEISVKTDTGDVTGSLLTAKVFIIQTDTGDVDVPKPTSGGKCEISTDTGNIKIKIK